MSSLASLLNNLNKKHLNADDLLDMHRYCEQNPYIEVSTVGQSYLGKDIQQYKLGNGPTRILLWSQMHGDEPTATAAIFDLIATLIADPEFNDNPIKNWSEHFTLYFVPMLNPDGAELKTRQNAQGIDINRDAQTLQTPEGKLLMHLVTEIKPHIGFNLHDQAHHYKSGNKPYPSTIAFLAPPFDELYTIDQSRLRAMELIVVMREALESSISNSIARYDDDFSNKCFGDTLAGKGMSVILIESGFARDDPNRQIARQMNVKAILTSLQYLANSDHFMSQSDIVAKYNSIELNRANQFSSVLINSLNITKHIHYKLDICINPVDKHSQQMSLSFIGDASGQSAEKVLNAKEFQFLTPKKYVVDSTFELNNETYKSLLKQGYMIFIDKKQNMKITCDYPLLVLTNDCYLKLPKINQSLLVSKKQMDDTLVGPCLNQPAFMILSNVQNEVVYAVLNGQLIEL